MNISPYIDHTLLKATATQSEIGKLCEEAMHFGFAAVCIPPPAVKYARKKTEGSKVKVVTVIGFPLGYSNSKAKLVELDQAIIDGADELDAVINLMALKAGNWDLLQKEVDDLCSASHRSQVILKVIIESGMLTNEEIIDCCNCFGRLGVDFLKTSTGYAEKAVSIDAIKLMKQYLPASTRIKASGGIKTYAFAKELIDAGANRLGCSASVSIVSGNSRDKSAAY